MERPSIRFFMVLTLALMAVHQVALAETLTCTDKLGRTVTVKIPVSRAAIFQTYELIPALGIWDKVVGIARFAYTNDLIRATRPDIAKVIPSVSAGSGLDANMEMLLKLKPEVVITWSVKPDAVKFMEDRGLKTIAIYPDSLSELLDVIRLHGKLFGQEKKAETTVAEMEAIFRLVSDTVSAIPPDRKRKVLWVGGKPTMVSGKIGVTNDLIHLIGGINAASRISLCNADVPIERIVAWNPDIIFIWGNASYSVESILKSSQWKLIKAVREGRVYKAPIWHTWSPRIAPVVLWMAAKTYPEYFQNVNIEKEFNDFYQLIFGIPYAKVSGIEN